jgi:hypothetical protein
MSNTHEPSQYGTHRWKHDLQPLHNGLAHLFSLPAGTILRTRVHEDVNVSIEELAVV